MTIVGSRPASTEGVRPRVAAPAGARRGWLWPLAAVLLGVTGGLWPIPTAVALGVAGLLLLALAAPRTMVALTVLGILFVRPLEHLVGIEQLGYLDEGLVVVCALVLPLRRLINRRPLRTFPGQWWFAAFVVIGLLSGLFLHIEPTTYLTGAFVLGKGMILAWAVAQVDWAERHVTVAVRGGTVVIVFCLVATVANLALPGPWASVLASDVNAIEARSFLPSVTGPFTHPIDLGQFMALATIALASWRATVGQRALTLWLMVGTAVGALLTARRTAIGSVVVAWLVVKAKTRSTGVLLTMAVCVPLALVVLFQPLTTVVTATYNDYVATGNPEARTVLTVDSFGVATEYFPGGAGFGRFGSAVAATTYSPEYVARGYPEIWGLGTTPEEGRFLTDTEWPAIIGESGFFGAVAFALALGAIYRAGRRLWSSSTSPVVRWTGLLLMGWLVACVVQSIATVSFTGPPVYGLFFGLVGIVAALSDTPPAAFDGRGTKREDAGQVRAV